MAKTADVLKGIKPDKNTMKAMGIKESLNKMFYAEPKRDEEIEMLKFMFDNEEKERLGLHASSITKTGNFCYREQLINILYKHYMTTGDGKVPNPIKVAFKAQLRENNSNPINLQRIYEQGTVMGYKWQMLFIRNGVGQKEDMDISRFDEEFDLSYTPDGIIELNGKTYVVELKSQKSTLFEKEKSHPNGIRQLKLYMYFEGQNRKIDGGFVLVDNKDTSDFKVLFIDEVNESDDDVATYLERLERLQRMKRYALKKKKLPKCDCKKCG